MKNMPKNTILRLLIVIIGIVGILITISSLGQHFYISQPVSEIEVGIQFRNNQIHDIVGPGVYNDFGPFVQLETISQAAVFFRVEDSDIITQDEKRIGLIVTGDVFRPGLNSADLIRENWTRHQDLYASDDEIVQRITNFTRQAMKVCVGERTFHDSFFVGTDRVDLQMCISENVQQQANVLGLRIGNVDVPDLILSPEDQAALDELMQCRIEAEQAVQEQLNDGEDASEEQIFQAIENECN
ncbi:MAG: SPFH domain-containing protein [Chloroflexota bacterium]